MTILIATANPAKVREITAVLSAVDPAHKADVYWTSLNELPARIAEPHEDGRTCAENAVLKARYYSRSAGTWALADDSGLEVDALHGAPGVDSAYYERSAAALPRAERDPANNRKLIAALRGVPPDQRTARFRCCLALADGERVLLTTEGTVEGTIIDQPRGDGGFGYDPHFLITEMGKTTAELSRDEKNRISHRGRALRALLPALGELLRQVAG